LKWGWTRPLALAALVLGLAPGSRAQADDENDLTQVMYRQALQSIAEGRKNDASDTLMRVIEREPLHAGAWMDLALIQCALGHADEAERLFGVIRERFNPSPGIIRMINEARAEGCAGWQPVGLASISIGRGIDQNVNQGTRYSTYATTIDAAPVELVLTDDFRPKHDQYTAVAMDYLRDLTPNGTTGYVQFQNRRYDQLGLYNSSSLFGGVDTPWRHGNWTLHGSANLGLITLGHQLYQRQAQLQARLGPPLPLPGTMQFSLVTAVSRVEYLTLSNFNANTGELRGQFNYRREDTSASASLTLLADHAALARPGGNRHGSLAMLQWRQRLFDDTSGELAYTRQAWYGASAYSPGFIDQTRNQITQTLRATVNYPLTRTQSLQLEARAVRNKENISIFRYSDRSLQLSWIWQGL
jgi:hypothetical protein